MHILVTGGAGFIGANLCRTLLADDAVTEVVAFDDLSTGFAANVEGSEAGVELLAPALEEADPELLTDIEANFAELDEQLAEYEDGDGGYLDYPELADDDRDAMAATLAELSENLSQMAGALDLEP